MLEKKVRNGKLVQYVAGGESSGKKQGMADEEQSGGQQPEQNRLVRNVVDVISGGSVGRVTRKKC